MSELGQRLIRIVREKAAEKPDFVYTPREEYGRYAACQYVRKGCPDCLIGHALVGAGVINLDIETRPWNKEPFHALADRFEIWDELDPEERRWLGLVQKHQDNFRPWGKAVEWTDNPDDAPPYFAQAA